METGSPNRKKHKGIQEDVLVINAKIFFLIYFNGCCDKIPGKKQLGICSEKNFVQTPNGCSHVVCTREAHRGECWAQAAFCKIPLLFNSRTMGGSFLT